MCRMIAVSYGSSGKGAVKALIEALVRSAEEDPYQEEFIGSKSHCHGYGFVLLSEAGGRTFLFYERADLMDCSENLRALESASKRLISLVESSSSGLLILHARRTVEEPRGTANAHPFYYSHAGRSRRREFFFAQNGGVKKEEMAFSIGLEPDAYVDSYIALVYMAKDIAYGEEPLRVLSRTAREFTNPKSAFNSALLLIETSGEKSEASLYVIGYLGEMARRSEVGRRYYKPYLVKGDGIAGYASSTVRDILSGRGSGLEFEPLEGEVVKLSLGGTVEVRRKVE